MNKINILITKSFFIIGTGLIWAMLLIAAYSLGYATFDIAEWNNEARGWCAVLIVVGWIIFTTLWIDFDLEAYLSDNS